jgi:hypothetical protein
MITQTTTRCFDHIPCPFTGKLYMYVGYGVAIYRNLKTHGLMEAALFYIKYER